MLPLLLKKIAKHYLRTWFAIDLIAVIPVSLILKTGNYNSLARVARFPKLYRLLKISRYESV